MPRAFIGEKWDDDILARRADGQAIDAFGGASKDKTLPEGIRFGIGDSTSIIRGVLAIGELLDPIRKTARILAVVMGEARRKVEMAIRGDGPRGTRRHAQFALQARIVGQGSIIVANLRSQQHGSQQNIIAELGVNHAAVQPHGPQARSHSHGLVRDELPLS